jgi:hypothetical protein
VDSFFEMLEANVFEFGAVLPMDHFAIVDHLASNVKEQFCVLNSTRKIPEEFVGFVRKDAILGFVVAFHDPILV